MKNSANSRESLLSALRDAVTVSEAAQRLGVTARTVQRRIEKGELKTIDMDGTRFVRLSSATAAPAPATTPVPTKPRAVATPVKKVAPKPTATRAAPTKIATRQKVTPTRATTIPVQPVPETQAPAAAPTVSDDITSRYISQIERENIFLRSQIEAHARAEAELRAALREALRAMPKALPGGNEGMDSSSVASSAMFTTLSQPEVETVSAVTSSSEAPLPVSEVEKGASAIKSATPTDTASTPVTVENAAFQQSETPSSVAPQDTPPISEGKTEVIAPAVTPETNASTPEPPKEAEPVAVAPLVTPPPAPVAEPEPVVVSVPAAPPAAEAAVSVAAPQNVAPSEAPSTPVPPAITPAPVEATPTAPQPIEPQPSPAAVQPAPVAPQSAPIAEPAKAPIAPSPQVKPETKDLSAPVQNASTQNAPTQAAPTQAAPTQAAPTQAAPTQAAPTQAAPTQAAPTQAAPTQAAPTQAAPVQTVEPKGGFKSVHSRQRHSRPLWKVFLGMR